MNNIVYFFKGDYFFLSNFYPHEKIVYDKKPAFNVETLYQALKTNIDEEVYTILESGSPFAAKKLGKKVTLRNDWNDIKVNIMKELLELKFSIPLLREKLVNTKGMILIEGNHWNDTFWGVCKGKGENTLGELLMKVRLQITQEPIIEFNKQEIYGRIFI